MNLKKLFDLQKKLDDRIVKEKGLQGQNLTPNKFLAFQVELAELANEWRGFKHWSRDQEPSREKMLVEYVDCLHFILSIGLETGCGEPDNPRAHIFKWDTITRQISALMALVNKDGSHMEWEETWGAFIGLGELLGFSWEEVEAAYIDKNEVNHNRQTVGY